MMLVNADTAQHQRKGTQMGGKPERLGPKDKPERCPTPNAAASLSLGCLKDEADFIAFAEGNAIARTQAMAVARR